MLNTPFSPWPCYDEAEIEAVHHVLRSGQVNYWTGTQGRTFETRFAAWCQAKHAVAVTNGTVALELALKVLNIGAGDEVIVTPRTFLGSVSAIVLAGARPVFADVDFNSQNITPQTVTPLITSRTRAIMTVHLAGWPCDMTGFQRLAAHYGIAIIEDCAQAHGAAWQGQSVGSWGQVAAWSFCQDKIMTTGGEGGMLTTSNPKFWSKGWSYKDHGKGYDTVYHQEHPPGFRWLHDRFGTNWRMLEMQAAIGLIQLDKMPLWHQQRTAHALAILNTCRAQPALRTPLPPPQARHAWYRAYTFVQPEALKTGWSRDRIIDAICAEGVPCYSGSCPEVYLEKAFDKTGWRPAERLPVARALGETSLMFLTHPNLTDQEISQTCDAIEHVMQQATR